VKILTERRTVEAYEHVLPFHGPSGSEIALACHADGSPLNGTAEHRAAYDCATAPGSGYARGTVRTLAVRHREPAVGECVVCGARVTLGDNTNSCDCGAEYNGSGQRLAPREQWGEETGEHPLDCV
jgi:hypothetical protein